MNSDCSTWPAQRLPERAETGLAALRAVLVAVFGGALVILGLVGLFLPLPGVLLIVMGLSMLGTRFAIARRWLESVQRSMTKLRSVRR